MERGSSLTFGQVVFISILAFMAGFAGVAIAAPTVLLKAYKEIKDPKLNKPDWQLRYDMDTPSGKLSWRLIDRGVIFYSHTDELCEAPDKFSYKGYRGYNDRDMPNDGFPYEEHAGPVARTITWRILGKIKGVNVVDFGAIESIQDPYMVYVGITPGYEDKSAAILTEVAGIITAVQRENKTTLAAALKAEEDKRQRIQDEAERKRREEQDREYAKRIKVYQKASK